MKSRFFLIVSIFVLLSSSLFSQDAGAEDAIATVIDSAGVADKGSEESGADVESDAAEAEAEAEDVWVPWVYAQTSVDGFSQKEGDGLRYQGMGGDIWAQVGFSKELSDLTWMNWLISDFLKFDSDAEGNAALVNNTVYFGPSFKFTFNDNVDLLVGGDVLFGMATDTYIWAGFDFYYLLNFNSAKAHLTGSLYHWNEFGFDTANTYMYYFNWVIYDVTFAFSKFSNENLDLGLFTWGELSTVTTRSYGTDKIDTASNNTTVYSDLILGLYYRPSDVFRIDFGANIINAMTLGFDSQELSGTDDDKYGAKIRAIITYGGFNVNFGFMPMWNQTANAYQNDFDFEITLSY